MFGNFHGDFSGRMNFQKPAEQKYHRTETRRALKNRAHKYLLVSFHPMHSHVFESGNGFYNADEESLLKAFL